VRKKQGLPEAAGGPKRSPRPASGPLYDHRGNRKARPGKQHPAAFTVTRGPFRSDPKTGQPMVHQPRPAAEPSQPSPQGLIPDTKFRPHSRPPPSPQEPGGEIYFGDGVHLPEMSPQEQRASSKYLVLDGEGSAQFP
jgi:hypothetical protein